MDIQKPLFWHQGLFLQPQHFQYMDLHAQSLLRPQQRFVRPHFWGVGGIEISAGALGNLSFEVLKGEFLFQDGTYAVFPGNAVLEARSFEEAWENRDQPLTIYLGLRKLDQAGANVTVLPELENLTGVATRYVTRTEPEESADLHQSGPVAELQHLNLLLKVFWEDEKEQAGDYLLLPVACLEKQGDMIGLLADFVPPCLTIRSSEPLLKNIKDVRDQIASRSRQLEEYKLQRGIHTADFGSRDMVFLLALRTLNRYVPLLFHLTEGPQVHPWDVYGLLRQLIGELSTFSSTINVLGKSGEAGSPLMSYNHRQLADCFAAARQLITQLLDEITAGPDYVIPLTYDGTYYAAELPPAAFEGRNRFYLVVDTEEDPAQTIDSLQTIAKLGSREILPILIARALPGVGVESLAVPPQELPRRSHCLYFQLDHHGEQWAKVQQSRNLVLYWDAAPEDFKAELMIVGKG